MKFEAAKLQLHPLVAYPAWNPKDPKFRPQDWVARYLVKAVKNDVEALKRSHIELKGRTFNHKNADQLVEAYCKWAADRLRELGLEGCTLAAIPNSGATPALGTFATFDIVQRIAGKLGPSCTPFGGIRFQKPLVAAHQGGTRNKDQLLANMVLVQPLPDHKPVVFFDDVCSSGGHLFAAQRLLAQNGHAVEHVITCGRTVNEPQPKMMNVPPEELSTYWWS